MITLKTLAWDNCFSYGEGNFLQLDANPATQIVGLNGHGKSSIPLILEELFYNKNSKGIKKAKVPNRYLGNTYNISGTFDKDGTEYTIEVSRKATTSKVVLLKDGVDISSHTSTNTYKTIEELLGMDFKTFSQLIYQNPKSSLQFLTATDTNRKKFLIDLLHLELYTEIYEIIKDAAKELNIELSGLNSSFKVLSTWLADNTLTDDSILPLNKIEITTEEEAQKISALTEELANISEKNKKISKNNEYKKLLSNIDIDAINSMIVEPPKSYDEYMSKIGELTHKVKSAEALMTKINKVSGTCPTCLQDIDEEIKKELLQVEGATIENAEKELATLKSLVETIKSNNEAYHKKQKLQKEWELLWVSIDKTLPNELLNSELLKEELNSLKLVVEKKLAEKARLEAENRNITQRNTRIQVITEQKTTTEQKLAVVSQELSVANERSNKLEILKKAFSTNGLLAYKIENLVKELEVLTNEYLAEFSGGEFSLEFAVVNDKLSVLLTVDSESVDIEELSSGELAKVNTSALLAIRKLMSGISKNRLNILFLDEVISTLDDFGKEKLVEILLKEENLNTFVVSHGWLHPLLDKLSVVKENRISRIE